MFNLRYFLVFIVLLAWGQAGRGQAWQWGRRGAWGESDNYVVTTDDSGNVFGVAMKTFDTGTIEFGSILPPAIAPNTIQAIWVKYDPSGRPLWAGGNVAGTVDNINSISTDHAGNLIVFGTFYDSFKVGTVALSTHGQNMAYFIAKISPGGAVLWAISDGACYEGFPGGVTTDDAGNIYITGSLSGINSTIGADTVADIFVAKYSPSGSLTWVRAIEGDYLDGSNTISVLSTGEVFIAGVQVADSLVFGSSVIHKPGTRPAAFIGELSPAGVPLWGEGGGGHAGSALCEQLVKDADDNLYVIGMFNDTAVIFGDTSIRWQYADGTDEATFVMKFNAAHTTLWGRCIASPRPMNQVKGYSIAYSACANRVWIAGGYTDSVAFAGVAHGQPYMATDPTFIASFDPAGNERDFSVLLSGGDDPIGVACDNIGNVYVSGDFSQRIYLGPDTITAAGDFEYFFVGKYGINPAGDTAHSSYDTNYCGSDSLLLSAPPGYNAYAWNDGVTTANRSAGASGTWWVYCYTCGDSVVVDTFHVSFLASLISGYKDTSVCSPSEIDTVVLTAPAGGRDYLWFNGDTTISDTVISAGGFWVSYYRGCTLYTDTFYLTFRTMPWPITGIDTVCRGLTTNYSDIVLGGRWSCSDTAIAAAGAASGAVTGVSPGTATIFYTLSDSCSVSAGITVVTTPCLSGVGNVAPPVQGATVFPNPAYTDLTISTGGGYHYFTITDITGRVVMSQPIAAPVSIVTITDLPPGLFYITISGDAGTQVLKFAKE